jgi:hypothetical protein
MWGTENYVLNIDQAARSRLLPDFSDRSILMMEFSVIHMFRACVTLGFSDSADPVSKSRIRHKALNCVFFLSS